VGTELRVCPPSPCKMATCPIFVLCHTSTSIREGLQVGPVGASGLLPSTQREALQARDPRAVQSTARFMLRFVSCDSQLVIFDCDGVLVDSEVISNRVLAEMLSTEGLPTTLAQARCDYQDPPAVLAEAKHILRVGGRLAVMHYTREDVERTPCPPHSRHTPRRCSTRTGAHRPATSSALQRDNPDEWTPGLRAYARSSQPDGCRPHQRGPRSSLGRTRRRAQIYAYTPSVLLPPGSFRQSRWRESGRREASPPPQPIPDPRHTPHRAGRSRARIALHRDHIPIRTEPPLYLILGGSAWTNTALAACERQQ
jgi:hypothetical protein